MIICDTAHNEAALKEVVSQLTGLEYKELHFVIGFSDDKELQNISKIFPKKAKYYFIRPKVARGRDNQEVQQIFKSNNRVGEIYSSVKEVIVLIKKTCNKNDVIFIGGSTFIVSEIYN